MTEDDVKAMEADVLATPLDTEFEREWAAAARAEFQRQAQKLQAEWKMWRFLRDDAKAQALAKQLATVRTCLAYLDGVLQEPA